MHQFQQDPQGHLRFATGVASAPPAITAESASVAHLRRLQTCLRELCWSAELEQRPDGQVLRVTNPRASGLTAVVVVVHTLYKWEGGAPIGTITDCVRVADWIMHALGEGPR